MYTAFQKMSIAFGKEKCGLKKDRIMILFKHMFQPLCHDGGNVVVRQGIVDGFSLPAEFDKGGMFENTELMGNGALGHG